MTLNREWITPRHLLILLMSNQNGIEQNQIDICEAISAGLIRIRLGDQYIGKTRVSFEGRTVRIPNHLSPNMLDWERSIARRGFGWRIDPPLNPPLDRLVVICLELNFEDLNKIWGTVFKAGFGYLFLPDSEKTKPIKEIIKSHQQKVAIRNRPGGGGAKTDAAVVAMIEAVHNARTTFTQLQAMKQKELSSLYPKAARTTLVAARERALRRLRAEGYLDATSTKA